VYVSCLLLLLYCRSKYCSQQSVRRQTGVDVWGRRVLPPWTAEPKRRQNKNSRILLIRVLVIRITNYPERLGPCDKFVNSTKLICLEINGYWLKYVIMLWH
jgi:hypothetical protein